MKKKEIGQKTKFRVTFLFLSLIISSVFFASQFFSYITQIIKTNKEINSLEAKYNYKLHEEEVLNDEINKLEDPEYLAKYAREKYLYSKENEIIIKIEE